MKRLIVFRHAKSSWDDADLDDHDRPLAPRGERDAPEMARRIIASDSLKHGALLLTSTARRARATAAALADAAGGDVRVVVEAQLYLATPGTILAVVAAQPAANETIVVVGHNPGLTELVNLLLPDLELLNLPTAGAVSMRLPISDWNEIGTTRATLEYTDFPKQGKTQGRQ